METLQNTISEYDKSVDINIHSLIFRRRDSVDLMKITV